jgi:hypothetical protein
MWRSNRDAGDSRLIRDSLVDLTWDFLLTFKTPDSQPLTELSVKFAACRMIAAGHGIRK